MTDAPVARFRVVTVSLWRHRIAVESRRYLAFAVALAGIAASLRYAIAPPGLRTRRVGRVGETQDRPAEGFALIFARRYLQWRASMPRPGAESLASFTAGVLEPAAGLVMLPRGVQRVQWSSVVGSREPQPGYHVYTGGTQAQGGG
jgi:hypothetical protein